MPSAPYLPSPAADRALVRRAAAGDERAVAQLYDRFGGVVYAVAHRVVGERADAEEVVLETFSQAWRDAARFESARGSVAAWLTMMARSRALDLLRARARRERATATALTNDPDAAPGMGAWRDEPGPNLDRDERRQRVAAAMEALSPPQRQAIELAFFEGLSHSEIAARLGEPLGTVKTRVRLGMQKLRELLRPFFFGQDA